MSEHEGYVWCNECDREVWALKSGSGRKWVGVDCGHRSMEYKNLGWANGWNSGLVKVNGEWVKEKPDEYPAEYLECVRLRHMCKGKITTKEIAHNCYEHVCEVCKITWKVDTSD